LIEAFSFIFLFVFFFLLFSLATTTNSDDQNEVNGNHQIVLLANEQMEPSDNEQAPDDAVDRKASNDEELTPLNWLHDKNLLKGDSRSSEALSSRKLMSPSHSRNQFVMSQSAIADRLKEWRSIKHHIGG
jgi:hypothetical protein